MQCHRDLSSLQGRCTCPYPTTQPPSSRITLPVYLPSVLKAARCIYDLPPAIRQPHQRLELPSFTDVSSVSTKVPCEEDARPGHKKDACSSSHEIPNQFPGGLGENMASLRARNRALSSKEGYSEVGLEAQVLNMESEHRVPAGAVQVQ